MKLVNNVLKSYVAGHVREHNGSKLTVINDVDEKHNGDRQPATTLN